VVKLIALYTKPENPGDFDKHYHEVHVPLVQKVPGLRRIELSKINGGPMGEARYYLMAEMYFDNAEAMATAMKSPEMKAAGKDVMSFAGKLVHMMFAEVR